MKAIAILAIALMGSTTFATAAPMPAAADLERVYRVVWGEVRGSTDMEIAGVCHVVFNRMLIGRWGGVRGVVEARKQFQAFDVGNVNRAKLLRARTLRLRSFRRVASICETSLEGRAGGWMRDPTRSATHYWHGSHVPYWAKGKRVLRIGRTHFVRLERVPARAKGPADAIGRLLAALDPPAR